MDGISDSKSSYWPSLPKIFPFFKSEAIPHNPQEEKHEKGEELLKKAKPLEEIFPKHTLLLKKIFPWMTKSCDGDLSKNLLNFLPETLAIYPENLMSKTLRTFLEEIFELSITQLPSSAILSEKEILSRFSLEKLKQVNVELFAFLQASDDYIKTLEAEIDFFEPICWQEKNYRLAVRELNAKLSNFKAALPLLTQLQKLLEKLS